MDALQNCSHSEIAEAWQRYMEDERNRNHRGRLLRPDPVQIRDLALRRRPKPELVALEHHEEERERVTPDRMREIMAEIGWRGNGVKKMRGVGGRWTMTPKPWTEEEVETLKRMRMEGRTGDEIAEALGRSKGNINQKVVELRLPRKKHKSVPIEKWPGVTEGFKHWAEQAKPGARRVVYRSGDPDALEILKRAAPLVRKGTVRLIERPDAILMERKANAA